MSININEIPAGVVTGENLVKLMKHAKDNCYALPAVNVTSSSTVNAALQAARDIGSPIVIQVSNGGGKFYAGKGCKAKNAGVLGSVSAALHVRQMAKYYGVPVVMHSDHCSKKLLPWFDGMLAADEEYFAKFGEPLFSSHMLDLSEEPLEEIVEVCKHYMTRMAKINCWLETEVGITGGEEDGVDNSDVESSKMYTQPEEVHQIWKALSDISPMFSIAAAFGNVHGVYKPGNVKLRPEVLLNAQHYIAKKSGSSEAKPVYFVFHGGSGSEKNKIQESLKYGVVKFNIDTDTQWAYWDGVREFVAKNAPYMQAQIGNPLGADKPNKKFYDPRVWMRKGEETLIARLHESFADLNSVGVINRPSKL